MAETFIVHDESILKPTFEEFSNFKNCMGYLDENYFDPGFARIGAPPEWIGQWDAVSSIPSSLSIKPIKQLIQRNDKGYLISALPIKSRTMTLGDYVDQVSKTERHFNNINEPGKTPSGELVSGIHTPYCYVGSWMSSFGWHTEDYDAYSINVQLHGKPKIWHFIPREDGLRFDNIVS
ncbi:lysine-specific demethylase 4D-like, partial [Diachasma alloeum]|uniref:lysine-specific demethylase 4D-like n=1 Tax=Diachasma alloeum TaxID=454923 RepID=UPI0007384332